jgi:hypothetical protein
MSEQPVAIEAPPDLLDPNGFAKFKAKDEEWFLGVAGDAVRAECGWHIYPVLSDTNVEAEIGAAGIIMLPSLNIVSVERLTWNGTNLVENQDFIVHSAGWLELVGYHLSSGPRFVGQRGNQRPAIPSQILGVTVDFTHGYETLPRVVAEVGYEIAAGAIERPSGAVDDLTAGPYRFKFRDGAVGATLSEDQCNRLGPYSIVRV